jgi:hypothetical protein
MSRITLSPKVSRHRANAPGRWPYPASREEAIALVKAEIRAGWERVEQLRRKRLKDDAVE